MLCNKCLLINDVYYSITDYCYWSFGAGSLGGSAAVAGALVGSELIVFSPFSSPPSALVNSSSSGFHFCFLLKNPH